MEEILFSGERIFLKKIARLSFSCIFFEKKYICGRIGARGGLR
jgi:hypothetical protein